MILATLSQKPGDLLPLVKALTAAQKSELDALLLDFEPKLWVSQPGPQQMAAESAADIVFYGGAAGGGKTDLLLGLPITEHQQSIIFRREAVQLVGIEERLAKILGSRRGYNSTDGLWRIPNTSRVLELGSVKDPDDWMKYQGRPHDYIGFDELPHFTELQFRTLIGWLRTDDPTQRCRVMCAGNPPTDSSGEWVKRFWGPWLDPMHSNPAKPGELRWFITNEKGEDEAVDGPDAGRVIDGEYMKPTSRTFIPSRVDDNLFLLSTGYKRTLASLPEPLRSQMLRGDFQAGATDPEWQLIPTAWVKAAFARWKARGNGPIEEGGKGPMTALGLDPSRGGRDRTSAARRHGNWFDEVITAPGVTINDGPAAAAFVAPLQRNGVCIVVDAIGIGSSALDFIKGANMHVLSFVGSEGSGKLTKDGKLRMRNKRAEAYWNLREQLDPEGPNPIALPPDQDLLGDLCAVRYKVVSMGQMAAVQMNDKDDIRTVLGRSPDKGDSVALTCIDGIPEPLSAQEEPKSSPADWRL
jgi:hypothetical protein